MAEGEKIVLRGVNFDFDKANIRPDAAVILDEAVRILGGSGPGVSIEGHTDWIGSDAYNAGLSERRANSVQALPDRARRRRRRGSPRSATARAARSRATTRGKAAR